MIDDDEQQHSEESTPSTSTCTPRPPSTPPVAGEVGRPYRKLAPKRKKAAPEENLLMLACEKLQAPAPTPETAQKEEHDSLGQTVAHDLRSMSREQVIHEKKIISDVLYEGQLNNLSRSSRVSSGNEYITGVPYARGMSDLTYATAASSPSPNPQVYRSYSQY